MKTHIHKNTDMHTIIHRNKTPNTLSSTLQIHDITLILHFDFSPMQTLEHTHSHILRILPACVDRSKCFLFHLSFTTSQSTLHYVESLMNRIQPKPHQRKRRLRQQPKKNHNIDTHCTCTIIITTTINCTPPKHGNGTRQRHRQRH